MSLAFVIELRSQAVGLVVRDGAQYRFYTAVREFSVLDGQPFPSPQDAEKAIRQQEAQAKRSSVFGQANEPLAVRP
jgi:hypothetical protein